MDRGNLGGLYATGGLAGASSNISRSRPQIPINEITTILEAIDCSDNLDKCLNNQIHNKSTMDNMPQKLPLKISQEISECNNAWMLYLQGLAGLCAAGARVSHSLQVLSHGLPVGTTAGHCRSAWDELLRATQAASQQVRTEVSAGLRDLASEEQTSQSAEQIVSNSLTNLINLQYQFCVACCDCLGNIAPHVQDSSLQQQLQQQQVSPSSECSGHRHQPMFSRLLLGGQRRWSEVARRTAEQGEEEAPRRWSVPWEGPGAGGGNVGQHLLTVPLVAHERSSRSTTPDSASLASQEELQDVISLLSCRPAHQLQPSSRQLPGVTLTNCSQIDARDTWSQGGALFPASGGWCQGIAESPQHGETVTGSRRSSPRPSHQHRTRGWTPHEPLYNTIWGEQEGEQSTGNLEVFSASNSDNSYQQRKSSSSTDSSSSSSLPQHNHHVQQQEQSRPMYSMWSGSEMTPPLPFIQLPSSPAQDTPGSHMP